MSTQAIRDPSAQPHASDKATRQRLAGVGYARAAGIGVGLFMIGFAPFNGQRLATHAPDWLVTFEFLFFIAYGALLAMPWGRIRREETFRFAFGLLLIFSAAFGFLMVVDLMFQFPLTWDRAGVADPDSIYQLKSEKGDKPAPPAFQGALVFLVLLQVPTVLFQRKPQLLG